jgi:Glycine zipper
MPENSGQSAPNPWKWTAIAMAVVATTAVVTGVVVGSRRTPDDPVERVRVEATQPARRAATAPAAPRVPDQATVKACNEQAAAKTGAPDKTKEIVKDTAVGAVLGAAVGAAGGAIADGGKGAGKGAAIGGMVGAGAGALYGVNENRKNDAAYRDAYGNCLRARGYAA